MINYVKQKAPSMMRLLWREVWYYSRVRPTGFEPAALRSAPPYWAN